MYTNTSKLSRFSFCFYNNTYNIKEHNISTKRERYMCKKITHPQIGELEWNINGCGNYYQKTELVLYNNKIEVEIEFNIDKEDDEITQRQIDNYLNLINNHDTLFEKTLLLSKDYYNWVAPEYIEQHELFDLEPDQIPEKVDTIEELLLLLIISPLQIYLDTEYYDIAIGMGCEWDMEGLAVKWYDYEKGDYHIGTCSII